MLIPSPPMFSCHCIQSSIVLHSRLANGHLTNISCFLFLLAEYTQRLDISTPLNKPIFSEMFSLH
ncbi:hypothetical protein EJD97_014460 [Solanum chilense]|uniref:Uncharacterized protein n=1 Tax=Solanum chilense TaxID=4083 RepID=A0A6N2C7V1_SOLCI|nr:hypothetical protein EJD97_014460 [Solanum chilense]